MQLATLGERIAADEGAEFKNPGLKKEAAAAEKLTRKRHASAGEMTDIVRAGFVIDRPAQADAIVRQLAGRHDVIDEGWVITKTGYMDRKALVRTRDGLTAEVQIWGRDMLAAKSARGRALYTEWRSLPEDSPRATALFNEQRALYATARGEAFGGIERGGSSGPNLVVNRDRQAASDISPAVDATSWKSTGAQSAEADSLASAPSENSTAGRSSQLTKSMDQSPSGSNDTTPPSRAQVIIAADTGARSGPASKSGGGTPAGEAKPHMAAAAAPVNRAQAVIAADPALKALADDTARWAAENGIAEPAAPANQNPDTRAEALRAAAVCLLSEEE